MTVQVDVPDYLAKDGFIFSWEENFKIKIASTMKLISEQINKDTKKTSN